MGGLCYLSWTWMCYSMALLRLGQGEQGSSISLLLFLDMAPPGEAGFVLYLCAKKY